MKCQAQTTSAMQDLAKCLEGHRFAMLTLRDEAGRLTSQPMTPQEMDAQGAIWILLSRGATADRITRDGAAVNLAFSDEGDASYVSVSARATLVDDAERKRELWSAMARPWFPGGVDDPQLLLLKLQPEHAEVWEGPQSSVVRALAFAASVAAAKPIGLGEQRTLDTSSPVAR